ncbi:hypothetical protein BDR26DRAFT_863102 [Obelidium mucronatum]|nr:hypothetical protein BDR26DRAFT_863102 [Obelidium mucronatum]
MDTTAKSPESNILQKYREGDSITNFFRSLSFDFVTSFVDDQQASTDPSLTHDLAQRRIKYHRMKESLRDQVVWSVIHVNKMVQALAAVPVADNNKREFRVGILLSDILPETGEADCKVLADALLAAGNGSLLKPKQICILGRRDHLVSWVNEKHPGIQIVSDWERNTKVTAALSMIVLLGSAMHLTLTEEQLRGHDISNTILMPVISGITETRMKSLLGSSLIISPHWNFEEYHVSDRAPQNITWNMKAFTKGVSCPDLDTFRRVCSDFCRRHGLSDSQSKETLQSVLPESSVSSVAEFQAFNLDRHDPMRAA